MSAEPCGRDVHVQRVYHALGHGLRPRLRHGHGHAAGGRAVRCLQHDRGLREYTIELDGSGGALRIHCKGVTATEVADLSRALWSAAC